MLKSHLLTVNYLHERLVWEFVSVLQTVLSNLSLCGSMSHFLFKADSHWDTFRSRISYISTFLTLLSPVIMSYFVSLVTAPHDALFVVGSLDEAVLIKGLRYHPVDIETSVIRSHKGICEWFVSHNWNHHYLTLFLCCFQTNSSSNRCRSLTLTTLIMSILFQWDVNVVIFIKVVSSLKNILDIIALPACSHELRVFSSR